MIPISNRCPETKTQLLIFDDKRLRVISCFVVVCFLIYSWSGCYSYSRGDLVGTSKIPESRAFESWYYRVLVVSRPTVGKPSVLLQLQKIPRYRIATVNHYAELREPNPAGGWLVTLAGGGMAYGGTRVDTLQSGGKTLQMILVVGGVILLLYGITIISASTTPTKTGKVVEREKAFTYEDGSPVPVDRTRVSASLGMKSIAYISDSRGQIELNLVNDFALKSFPRPERLSIKISSQSPEISHNVALSSSEWTVPFVQIEARRGWMFEKPSSTSRKMTEYRQGAIYKVLDDKDPDWLKVDADGTIGWIPVQVGAKFWSIPK